MKPKHVAIVGGGFSGAALAIALVDAGARVTLIDHAGAFGRGLAYKTRAPEHVLNVPAERMSVRAAAPDDFFHWLRERAPGAARGAYAPRALFGVYVGERLAETAAAGPLELIDGEAIAYRETSAAAVLELAGGSVLEADHVVLAYGHLPSRKLFDASALADGVYLGDPWDTDALAAIAPERDVLLVGAGLTMVDAALVLARAPRTGKLFALSRRGLGPRAHVEGPATAAAPLAPPLAVSEALRFVRAEIRAAAARGEPWQSVINRLRPDTQTLWKRLPLDAQRRFLRHLRPYWDAHRHRAAPEPALKIQRLIDLGQLSVLGGRIAHIEACEAGARVHWRPRGAEAAREMAVSTLINCTGASADVAESEAPLLRQVLREGWARPHPTGLGLDVDHQGALFGRNGEIRQRLSALGPPTQGAFWEITAAPEIRESAGSLARRLLEQVG